MADAAVEFLLGNLQQLLIHHVDLISSARKQVEKLETNLRLFNAFLKDTAKKRRKSESLRELASEIRDVVYEAEDVIDVFVTQAALSKTRNYFVRAFQKPVSLYTIAKDVENVGSKVRDIFNLASLTDGDQGGSDEFEAPIVRQHNVVGFEDEAKILMDYLQEETLELDVISIIGMPGLGKTTLAGKIFWDRAVKYEFPTRVWVYISQEFKKKDIFIAILRQLTSNITDDIHHKSDDELANLVSSLLEKKAKFLIVMDDVWTDEDWKKLRMALPTKKLRMGKILITSRHVEVARCANRDREPHMLRLLTEDESKLLLKMEVFGKPEYPHQDLETPGTEIVKRCGGLPLAIVVIGGILVKRFSVSDAVSMRNAWNKVSENVSACLNEEDSEKHMEKIIGLSYNNLPHHLRECFLYFGIFPEDFEIPVWKLIRMWIAEGFIQSRTSSSLEETAESYLDDLINRNLVRVEKKKCNGRAKTCRIHDMLRDFCKTESGKDRENFLQEIKISSDSKPPIFELEKCRRLCIHSNVLSFVSSKPYGPRVRSFACFSKEKITLENKNVSDIPALFKLLRVLEISPIKFTKFPTDIYDLVHLRYITLSFTLSVLPSSISKLWNLQTLIVDTGKRTLEIKADIWKMVHLRHLKTNASALLPNTSDTTEGDRKLQTLGTISPQSCTKEVINRALELRKLGIRGRLSLLLESRSGSFDNLVKLRSLEKLKLVNDVFPELCSKYPLPGLPLHYKFPPKLKSLTLSKTFLDWSQMTTLGLLDHLEVLKLKENAFMGRRWETTAGYFRRLEVLHMEKTDLVLWVVGSPNHFPRLRWLGLTNCVTLQEIPIGFADILSLQGLNLHCSTLAVGSAKRICDAIMEKRWEQNAIVRGFKLTIYPDPDALAFEYVSIIE